MTIAGRDGPSAPPTRTDWAEGVLRREILTGQLRPGQRLKLSELIDRYPGLTPTPVREALSRLAGAGLVELLPQRGVRVSAGSRADLCDVYENRMVLETLALTRSMKADDDAWRDEVLQAYTGLDEASVACADAETGNLSTAELMRWESAHRAFHFALFSRCDSPWLVRLLNLLYDSSIRYRYLTIEWEPMSLRNAMNEHRRVLEAVLAGDVANAVAVMEQHMQLTVDSLEAVPALDQWSSPVP
jgi:GntR family transcriptional regulator, carbon starvation induced regulator